MKQVFEIPNGCNRVTIERQGNRIVTTFEPEFKDGDVIKLVKLCGRTLFAIIKGDCVPEGNLNPSYILLNLSGNLSFNDYFGFQKSDGDKIFLSPESLTIIQDALAKVGKQWNAEKKCVEDLKPKRWRAESNKHYWYLDSFMRASKDSEQFVTCDSVRHALGNYFKTEEQAEAASKKIKELLKQINP